MDEKTHEATAGIKAHLPTLAVILLLIACSTLARNQLAPVQEHLKNDLGLADGQIALFQGLAYALPVALLGVPIGRLADRMSRVHLLSGLALCWTVGTFCVAGVTSFIQLFGARMLVGLGAAGAVPAAVSLMSDLSSVAMRGRMVMLIALFQSLGIAVVFPIEAQALSFAASPETATSMGWSGWRFAVATLGLIQIVILAIFLFVREPARREAIVAEPGTKAASFGELRSHIGLLLPLTLGMITVTAADAAAFIWAVPVLTRSFHLQPADFGAWMGALLFISSALGVLLGGIGVDLANRLGGGRAMMLAAAGGALLSIPAALFPLAPAVPVFALALGILLICGGMVAVVSMTAVAILIPNQLRGMSIGLAVSSTTLISQGIGPYAVSAMANFLGTGQSLAYPLALVGTITNVIGVISFWFAGRGLRSIR